MPTTSKLVPPMSMVSPTARPALVAYVASSTATSAPASEASSARPSLTVTADIGPTASASGSMPSTVNESTPNDPPPKPPPGPPWPSCGASPPVWPSVVPLSLGACGSSPEKVVLVRLRAPDAAATPSIAVTVSSVEASSVPRRKSVVSRDWLRVVMPSSDVLPPSSSKSNCGRAPPSAPGSVWAPVTVRSVPTP